MKEVLSKIADRKYGKEERYKSKFIDTALKL